MAYIQVHHTVFDHDKTVEMSDRLGIRTVELVGHLVSFWSMALEYCAAGIVPVKSVKRYARWKGKKDFCEALVSCGFARNTPDGIEIHNWDQYTKWYKRAIRERERVAKRREPVREQTAYMTANSTRGTEQEQKRTGTEQDHPANGLGDGSVDYAPQGSTEADGLVKAFHWVKAPSGQTIRREVEEMLRLGIESARIMSYATSPDSRFGSFWDVKNKIMGDRKASTVGQDRANREAEALRKANELLELQKATSAARQRGRGL